jgi:ankyrin repeat protein
VLPDGLDYETLPEELQWVYDEIEIWFLERKVRMEGPCRDFIMQEDVSSLFPTNCNLEQLCNKDERGETIMKPRCYLEKACSLALLSNGREAIKEVLSHPEPLWPEFSQNSLIVAAFIGEENLIRWLLENDANAIGHINTRPKIFGTALFAAVLSGKSGITSLLLNYGARPHDIEDLFSWAVIKNDVEMVQVLLKHKQLDPNKHIGPGVDPLLLLACKMGFPQIVAALLNDPRIDPDQRNYSGMTPLIAALNSGNICSVQLLQDRSVNPSSRTGTNDCSLYVAAQKGQDDTVNMLLQRPDVNPNSISRHGQTPLMAAVLNNHEKVIDSLLYSPRVNPNTELLDQGTVLVIAAERGQTHIVQKLLRRQDIDVNAMNSKGETAISLAATNRHVESFTLLINRTDLVLGRGKLGEPGSLVDLTNRRILVTLLDRFPTGRVNEAGRWGRILLIQACKRRDFGLVADLLKSGADPDQRDYQGSALEYARRKNWENYVTLLQKYQRSTTTTTSAGA